MGSAASRAAIAMASMAEAHWPEVARIYAEGIATGDATFETEVPPWPDWDADHLPDQRLVALQDGAVVGWAALSPSSGRCVYRGVAEISLSVRGGGGADPSGRTRSACAGPGPGDHPI